ncbi:MAG: ABC transporter substrate-binding protein [Christensenellales bacterium]
MKRIAAVIIALIMVLCFAACSAPMQNADAPNTQETAPSLPAAAQAEQGVLRVAALYDISTMDVAQTTDNYMVPMNVFDRLFESVVQADGSTGIVPSLCESYEVSEDGLTYTFTLKDGIVFSNGSALTASDVQYTFGRLLTAGGVNDDIPLEVAGAEALKSGEADTLSGFSVIDDLHFTITLNAANAGFVAELTGPAISVVDKETMEKVSNFGLSCEDTIGTGPYKITEWVVNDHYTLEYNDKYWGAEPSVKKMIVSIIPDASTQNLMYQNGELDIIDLESLDSTIVNSTYKTQYADNIISCSRVGLTYFALNENNEFLSDVKVRKAIQMAIDVDSIVQSIFAGDAIIENGIIPEGIWGFDKDLQRPAYDPEAAKAMLAEAGYADGSISFELAMDSSSSSNTQLVYQVVQQNLAAIGINAEIKAYDESSWLDLRKSGEMDSFIANWTMDYNDPANIMYTFFGSPDKTLIRSLNYYDKDVMSRVAAASGITDDDARMKEYRDLERRIVVDDAAWVPLFGNMHLFAIGERVASFTPYWAGYSNFYAKDVVLK